MLLLLFLSAATLVNGYWLSYSFWMCAHPLYQVSYWQIRFYLHLGLGNLCMLAWICLLGRTLRNRKQRHLRQSQSR